MTENKSQTESLANNLKICHLISCFTFQMQKKHMNDTYRDVYIRIEI